MIWRARLCTRRGELIRLKLEEATVVLRDLRSDWDAFETVFVWRTYDSLAFGSLGTNIVPRSVLDLGANIGLSTVWLAHQFPNIPILAVEPSQSNFEMAIRNCASFRSIRVERAAVGVTPGMGCITNPSARPDSFTVASLASDSPSVPDLDNFPVKSIADFLRKLPKPVYIKMDIEGAEEALFSGDLDWLADVCILAMECHSDPFRTVVIETMSLLGWSHACSFETEIFARQSSTSLASA